MVSSRALPLAGAKPIQRHREVVHPHPRHGLLLKNDARRSAGRLPDTPRAPVRTTRRSRTHRGTDYRRRTRRSGQPQIEPVTTAVLRSVTGTDNLIGLGYPPERVKTERFGGT